MRNLHILNLGAGIQSTTLYLMSLEGQLPWFDAAIMGDTQDEPEAVYRHLEWLQSLGGPPILIRTAGRLGDDLVNGTNSLGKGKGKGNDRFAAIPAFTATHHERRSLLTGCDQGRVKRQCTKEYKIEVVEKTIRRDILGLKPRQHFPAKAFTVLQYFGISWDERRRRDRVRARFLDIPWASPVFPLCDLQWFREDCSQWLQSRVPHEVPRSACVYCPYHSAAEWLALKQNPRDWARAVEVDRAIRDDQSVFNRDLHKSLYVHRNCIPLEMVDLEAEAAKERKRKPPDMFALLDCGMGMCGN